MLSVVGDVQTSLISRDCLGNFLRYSASFPGQLSRWSNGSHVSSTSDNPTHRMRYCTTPLTIMISSTSQTSLSSSSISCGSFEEVGMDDVMLACALGNL